ncbi:hypothetical protein LCGC14_0504370 [marine sediment metagenome]|uniref:Uncharacterized protein n=1 Tax=marine sediment metagenome TaxID=412755 RepID=A0A0F9SLB3_9ZZZZ
MDASWKIRRRIVNCTLLFCAGCIGKIVLMGGGDPATEQTALLALSALASTTIGAYVFGAVFDDNSARKNGGR